jgi:transposase
MANNLALESREVGGHPLIDPFFERLRLREFFQQALGKPDARLKIPHADVALLLIRNIALSRYPLYQMPEWLRRFGPGPLGLEAEQQESINDDRLGRTLDKLFESDRQTLMTRLVVHMVQTYGLDLRELHNDSTSLTFAGEYHEPPPRPDGRRRLEIVHGHNKDHRPDLKQLVWTLTLTRDGGVPVHYNVDDGNITDDQTHIRTWETLRQLVGHSHFMYVADCKLCTRKNMGHIRSRGGHFITVLPRSRKEDAQFKEWVLSHEVPWQVIWERAPLRRKHDPPDVFEAVEAPEPTGEGYRIVWYRSSQKLKRDAQVRSSIIQDALRQLHSLRDRVGHRQLKTHKQVQAAVDQILDKTQTQRWIRVQIVPREREEFKQASAGRPGKDTQYIRKTITVYDPIAVLEEACIRESAASDGIFPLITDEPADRLSKLELLKIYKYQPVNEKRHEQLKTAARVVPLNFKLPERIEAFLFLYFVATMIHALIERKVRAAMKSRQLSSIPIYPEERECRAPTADKLLGLFESLRVHDLLRDGQHIETFWDELTDVQLEVLDLLGIPASDYGH